MANPANMKSDKLPRTDSSLISLGQSDVDDNGFREPDFSCCKGL
jgi:hypothetical protein